MKNFDAIKKADEAYFITNCPGDGTRYTYILIVSKEQNTGFKTVTICPNNDGATIVSPSLTFSEKDESLLSLVSEDKTTRENVKILHAAKDNGVLMPSGCYNENTYTLVEVVLAAKAFLKSNLIKKVVEELELENCNMLTVEELEKIAKMANATVHEVMLYLRTR